MICIEIAGRARNDSGLFSIEIAIGMKGKNNMDNLLEMSTTGRHNLLTSSLFSRIFNLVIEKKVLARQEQYSIVYYGKKSMPNDVTLVKIEDIEDTEYFSNNTIYELNYVQPDFVLFKDNLIFNG